LGSGGGALICGNCKKEVSVKDGKCPICGKPLKSRKKGVKKVDKKIAAASIAVCALILVNGFFLVRAFTKADTGEVLEPPIETVAPTEFPIDYLEQEEIPVEGEEGEASPEQPPARPADLTKPRDEVEKLVLNISESAQRYFDNYHASVDYVTRNALFYEVPSSTYITPAQLEGVEGFNPQYLEESAKILYVKNKDMAKFIESGKEHEDFGIYAAYEAEGGHVVAGSGKSSFIPKEDFDALMSAYDSSRTPSRVNSKSEEYTKILELI
jgi:hypothetical protein